MSATGPQLNPGDFVPGTKYRVVREIGAGGMGVVYQVVKPPAIPGVLKLMSSELTAHEEFRTRFLDEVRVLGQLDHPNIVKVFDYDSLPDGTPFYVMELLHGQTVRDVLSTMGTIPPRVAFEITRQLCEALHAAHTHDIPVVHRDIKPENIFLHAPKHGEPVVKLIDFGVVAVADRQHDGTFVGTWKYAAPEQIRGERGTPQSDIYAVALVLYEMLCGIGPFEQYETGTDVAQAHMREIPPPVSRFASWVPASIVQLIAKSLSKDPRQRPRDAYAFAERLFELEWANNGKDANDHTSEGPLSNILSSVGQAAKTPDPNHVLVPSAPAPRAFTQPGLGGGAGASEKTTPGEDTLLAGLGATPIVVPSRKARESGEDVAIASKPPFDMTPRMPNVVSRAPNDAPTMDAPPSDPKMPVGAVRRGNVDSDTFATQESDTRRAAPKGKSRAGLFLAFGLLAVAGVAAAVVMRGRVSTIAKDGPPATTQIVATATATATASVIASAADSVVTPPTPVATAPVPADSAVAKGGRVVKGVGKAGHPPAATTPATPPVATPPSPATAPAPPASAKAHDPSYAREL